MDVLSFVFSSGPERLLDSKADALSLRQRSQSGAADGMAARKDVSRAGRR
jgi:hypothetical protein